MAHDQAEPLPHRHRAPVTCDEWLLFIFLPKCELHFGGGIIYIFNNLNEHGDPLKKTILLLAALFCCAALGIVGSSLAEDGTAAEEVLEYDSGFWTDLFTTPYEIAETVKFTPPRAPWTLTSIRIAGWDGFDNETLPEERTIYLEVRDENLNLLYHFTDSQLPYFTYLSPVMAEIEVPPTVVDGDFYVCFYDRGALGVAYNDTEPSGRSYLYDRFTGELMSAEAKAEGSEEAVPINWLIRAVGH